LILESYYSEHQGHENAISQEAREGDHGADPCLHEQLQQVYDSCLEGQLAQGIEH